MKKLIISSLLVLLCGCAATVPATRVQIGSFRLESPKEIGFTNLVAGVGTNGQFHVSIGGYSSHNDADVLATITAANIQMAGKYIDILEKLTKLLEKGGAAALVP